MYLRYNGTGKLENMERVSESKKLAIDDGGCTRDTYQWESGLLLLLKSLLIVPLGLLNSHG